MSASNAGDPGSIPGLGSTNNYVILVAYARLLRKLY